MKRIIVPLLILSLLLSSCSAGEFCKISDVPLRIFENITEVVVDEGNDAYFYSNKELSDLNVYQMEWDYASESYVEIRTVVKGITLTKGDALKIVFKDESDMPYVRITFIKDGKLHERYIYRDQNDRLWVLNQQQ